MKRAAIGIALAAAGIVWLLWESGRESTWSGSIAVDPEASNHAAEQLTAAVSRRSSDEGALDLEPLAIPIAVAESSSWTLEVFDATTNRRFESGVRIPSIFENAGGAIEMPREADEKSRAYRVDITAYAPVEIRHSGTQGDVRCLVWPAGGLSVTRAMKCRLQIHRTDEDTSVYFEDQYVDEDDLEETNESSIAAVHLAGVAIGSYEIVAVWAAGSLRREVEVRRGELTTVAFAVEDEVEPSAVVFRLLTRLAPSEARRIIASLQQRDDAMPATTSTARWRVLREQAIATWNELERGRCYESPAVQLAPGAYRVKLSPIGLQTDFEVAPGGARIVLLDALEFVRTRLEFPGWPEECGQVNVSWHYEGDSVGFHWSFERDGTPACVDLFPKPLEIWAVSFAVEGFGRTPTLKHRPIACAEPSALVLPGDRLVPELELDLYRKGEPAYLDPALRVLVEAMDSAGEMLLRRVGGNRPSTLGFALSEPGRYRITATLRGVTLFRSEIDVAGRVTRARIELP